MIAIRDEEMPKNCKECKRTTICSTYLNQQTIDPSSMYSYGQHERPDNCPLVEIVTCKNCTIGQRGKYGNCKKYCEWIGRITEDDYFCADGKRESE